MFLVRPKIVHRAGESQFVEGREDVRQLWKCILARMAKKNKMLAVRTLISSYCRSINDKALRVGRSCGYCKETLHREIVVRQE